MYNHLCFNEKESTYFLVKVNGVQRPGRKGLVVEPSALEDFAIKIMHF